MNKIIGIVVGVGLIVAVVFTGFLWTCCRVYVPSGQMAIVTAKTGRPLPPGRILAEPGEKGVLCGYAAKGFARMTFTPLDGRTYNREKIDISGCAQSEQFADRIITVLRDRYGEKYAYNLYDICLIGTPFEGIVPSISEIKELLAEFAQNGPSEANLAKVKDYMHKKYQESLRENTYYSGALRVFLKYGVDEITDYEQVLDSITAADVAAAVRDILAQGNQAKVIMYGTEE